MKRSSEQEILTTVELQCLKSLEQQDDIVNREHRSSSHIRNANSTKSIPPTEQTTLGVDFWLELNPELTLVKEKLKKSHERSESLMAISQSLKDFESNFAGLRKSSEGLARVIEKMQGDSAQVLEKQNKLVDLSVQIQENLDYYNYLNKFKFDFQCELGQRELFEDQLQVILSELTQGAIFFQTRPKFANAKKCMDRYKAEKIKVAGFSRTFLLKLFNKQSSFSLKYNTPQTISQFTELFTAVEPKPTVKFLCCYLSLFPQFKRKMEELVRGCKEQLDEQANKQFTFFELEVEEFALSSATLSLIGYLQLNQKELYNEVMVKYFLHYRTNLHQAIRNGYKFNEKGVIPQFQKLSKVIIYVCASEYWYLRHCMNVHTSQNQEAVKSAIANIIASYYSLLKAIIRQIGSAAEAYIFADHIHNIIAKLPDIIDKYCNLQEYRVYPLGCVSVSTTAEELLQLLKSPFLQLLIDLELVIENMLPKNFTIKSTADPCPQVQEFLRVLPYLTYSPKCATRYIVASLDQLIKSMKIINSRFESRELCYVWNITAVYAIHVALEDTRVQLIRTELSVDLQNTRSIIDRVREIERTGSWWDYAKEFVSVLSTGMPVFSELTLDFHQFIGSHFNDLCRKFIKDMTFIYGKNMIEYLQRLDRLLKAERTQIIKKDLVSMSHASMLKAQYEGLLVSIEKYVKDSVEKAATHKGYVIGGKIYGPDIMASLTLKVFDNLLQLISDFYILTAKSTDYEVIRSLNFEDISAVRARMLPNKRSSVPKPQ